MQGLHHTGVYACLWAVGNLDLLPFVCGLRKYHGVAKQCLALCMHLAVKRSAHVAMQGHSTRHSVFFVWLSVAKVCLNAVACYCILPMQRSVLAEERGCKCVGMTPFFTVCPVFRCRHRDPL
jgi:hypothetical protein